MKECRLLLALIPLLVVSPIEAGHAEKLCLKVNQNSRTKKITTSKVLRASCPRGFTELLDTATLVGPAGAAGATGATGTTGATGSAGATGPAGVDGETAVYGTGELGDLVVTSGVTVSPSGTANYANVTIQAGGILLVDSGTIIRCTGAFSNDGTVTVADSANGGLFEALSDPGFGAVVPPSSGIAKTIAGSPEYYGGGVSLYAGGAGGIGLGAASVAEGTIVRAPNGQGGGGGAAGHGASAGGGDGGGWFAVYAVGAISVGATGTVAAPGEDAGVCSGGGGGGVVILASKTSVTVAGSIDVSGGLGGTATANCAAGGGGGGGLVQSISPNNTVPSGNISVVGGNAGSGAAPNAPASGGGGGGASRGNGGKGQGFLTTPVVGSSGGNVTTTGDPTSVILG